MPLKLVAPTPGRSPHYRVRGTYLGVYLDRSTGVSERVLAKKRLENWKQEIENGQLVASGGPVFASAALAYGRAGGEKRFLTKLVNHFRLTPLSSFTQEIIDEAAAVLYPGASGATLNRAVYTPVCAVLHHVLREKAPRFSRPKVEIVETKWARPEEVERFLGHLSEELRPLGVFLAHTGCRISEALSLTWADVDLERQLAHIARTKNDSPRTVVLTPAILAELKPGEGRVFRYRHRSSVYKGGWTKAAVAAGMPWLTPHKLRHSWATWMGQYAGVDAVGLVRTGAWKDLKSVARYSHIAQIEEAKKVLQLPVLNPCDKNKEAGKSKS